MLTRAEQLEVLGEVALAPSVHNVQPARWRFGEGGGVTLFEDAGRRLPAGDPTGRDTAVSLGAAAEGLAIALSTRGMTLVDEGACAREDGAVRYLRIVEGGAADPLADAVARRWSHRGPFALATDATRAAAAGLASASVIVADADDLGWLAKASDRAALRFFRDDAFRGELRSWMRLSRGHPQWRIDGLNADAMAMSRMEAAGAGVVLGGAFRIVDRLGLADVLTAEAATVATSAAIVIVHRPYGEDPFDTGRHFYRTWLRAEDAGLASAVMASLVDDAATAAMVRERFAVPAERCLTNAMRVGRAKASPVARARIRAEDLLI